MSTDKRARQKANRASRVAAAEASAARDRTRSRIMTYGGLAALVVLVIVGVSILTSDDDTPTATEPGATEPVVTTPPAEPAAPECPSEDGSSPRTIDFTGPFADCLDPTASYLAVFDTSEGEIRVELDTENTPQTVNNFVSLARWGYYDETLIFRTDPTIDIIQGGSPHTQTNSDPGPGYTIADEPAFTTNEVGNLVGPYRYEPGQLVMARAQGPDSASAQYFFVTGPAAAAGLDSQGTYVVFGNTDEAGLAITQDIIGLHGTNPTTGASGPSRNVMVNSVTIIQS